MTIQNRYERPENYQEPKSGDALLARYAAGERFLVGADLWGANLVDADLRDANLWGANLRHADLRGVALRHADLRGADLRGADLVDADLRRADLAFANLENVIINWRSHQLVSEYLLRAAETVGQKMAAFYIRGEANLCWDEFLALDELKPYHEWAYGVLAPLVTDGDGAPEWLRTKENTE